MIALIDADNIAFACAASAEDTTVENAYARAHEMVEGVLRDSGADQAELWLTAGTNFRYSVYPEYKANRKDTYRPKWEKETKQYLVDHWGANATNGIEADDMLGIRAMELGDNSILAHLDKDINQIPGWHFNWELRRLGAVIREKKKYFVTLEEGNRFFYYQLCTGDATDNIKGLSGYGPAKTNKLLESTPPERWYEEIRNLYSSDEELDMNATCLYIWRKNSDSWKNLLNA